MAFLRRLGAAFEAGSPIIGHFRDQMVEDEQNQKKARVQLALQGMQDDAAMARTRLQEEGDTSRNAATLATQRANSLMTQQGEMLRKFVGDPSAVDRFRQSGAQTPFGVSLDGLGTSDDDRLKAWMDEISKADSYPKLGADETWRQRPGMTPDLWSTRVSPALEAQRGQLRTAAKAGFGQAQSDGSVITQTSAGDNLTTTPNAQTQGRTAATIYNMGTPGAVKRAGDVARAEANVKYDPTSIAGEGQIAASRAAGEAAFKDQVSLKKEDQEANQASMEAMMPLMQLAKLFDQVGTDSAWQNMIRSVTPETVSMYMDNATLNPSVPLMDRMGRQYAMKIWRGLGGTGQNVSDTDIRNILGGIPTSTTPTQTGQKMLERLMAATQLTPLTRQLRSYSPSQRIQVMGRWLDMVDTAPEDANQIIDELTGITIPNVKRTARGAN